MTVTTQPAYSEARLWSPVCELPFQYATARFYVDPDGQTSTQTQVGAKMLKKQQGFTLIELLIVIVIIGILAAIAIPKFGKTREKAYFKAMMSDLRNLQSQQEVYYSNPANNYTYSSSVGALPDFTKSQGV